MAVCIHLYKRLATLDFLQEISCITSELAHIVAPGAHDLPRI
jgi:hypothetical protein